MAVLSKSRVLPALMLLLGLAHAQYFADMNVRRRRPTLADDSVDENVSAVDKLDGNSSWWDYIVAHQ